MEGDWDNKGLYSPDYNMVIEVKGFGSSSIEDLYIPTNPYYNKKSPVAFAAADVIETDNYRKKTKR